ncbi:MAG: UDP-2,3-diacylglucosamine diphosphatase LpxI [Phycisphaeraceae bacterium]|nr:UDP-2,3-diacylglucosamine diphosphatase LpxI [Phycisphaeraceae bacterium]
MSVGESLGIVCGKGIMPRLIAAGARDAGLRVVGIGLRHTHDHDFPAMCHAFHCVSVPKLGRQLRILRREGVRQAVLVGKVEKTRMYDPLSMIRHIPDLATMGWWFFRLDRHDRRPQQVLRSIAEEFARGGIELVDTTRYLLDHMADDGPMTRNTPTAGHQRDIDFVLPLIDRLTQLDIGQAIAVREADVVAVEAIEGTDAMIERAGRLCPRGGWVLVKMARPDQDKRFDVPVVGVSTIAQMKRWGGECLAIEAGGVIMLDKAEVIRAADEAGISIVGVRRSDP